MRTNRIFFTFGGIVLLLGLIWTCASEAPPPGGPKDMDPAEIIATSPGPGSTNISANTEVVLEFSEYLNFRTVEPAIFISPFIEDGYEVDVSRQTVTITFKQPLADSTTYIVTLGTAISDLRGNKLAQSYQLAFSTGPAIDRGRIAGRVYHRNLPKGDVSLLAYKRNAGISLDSLMARRPDYLANPDQEGFFSFSYMQMGEYLMLALQDKNSNYIYDPGEWTGIPADTFWQVKDTLMTRSLRMQMFQYPADSLVLTKVEQQNRHQIRIGLNRPPQQTPTVENFLFMKEDTLHPASLAAADAGAEYLLEIYNLAPDSTYLFQAQALTDKFDLPFGTNRNRRDVEISATPDTLPFDSPQVNIADSSKEISQLMPLQIRFSRAVQPIPADSLLQLEGVPSHKFAIRWEDDQTLLAEPDSLWPPESWITWTLMDSLVQDYRDSTYSDTLSAGVFLTEPGNEYGVITGTVQASDAWDNNLIRVEASDESSKQSYDVTASANGTFTLRRIPAGQYTLKSFYDSDSSGTYSFGRPSPFVPSEYFVIFQDSVTVRARWESSGYTLTYPDNLK